MEHAKTAISPYCSNKVIGSNQGWHGTFYPLGKTGWVKLGESG